MAQEEQVGLLSNLLSSYQVFITYVPLRGEVDFSTPVPLPKGTVAYTIPPRASLDPLEEAKRITSMIGATSTAILIPGRRFDASGTRHGQGGGWYDRFLAQVPRDWLRIGFCFEEHVSSTPLKRESWDQAMDYVVVVNRENTVTAVYSSEGFYD
jgi:5-formyltetrahydrofolate cyclo-ligase